MDMEMSKVLDCNVEPCAYNLKGQCHAFAITVGDEKCPACDTEITSDRKAGVADATSGVGACKVADCIYNQSLECAAGGIHVVVHGSHADCGTYRSA